MSDVFGLAIHFSEKVLLILERRVLSKGNPDRVKELEYEMYSDLYIVFIAVFCVRSKAAASLSVIEEPQTTEDCSVMERI